MTTTTQDMETARTAARSNKDLAILHLLVPFASILVAIIALGIRGGRGLAEKIGDNFRGKRDNITPQ
jgi:hypothetical protein